MDVLARDFFTDPELLQDPTPWYVALRERGPVWREPCRGVVVLSGIDEIVDVYADHEHFSAVVSTMGPLVPLPQPDEGDSWAEAIERRRAEIASERSDSCSARAKSPTYWLSTAKLLSEVATSGCSGPSSFSQIASDRS